MSACGYNDTSTVRLVDGSPEWVTLGYATHVSQELRDDPEARVFIAEKYRIGEWCEEVQAYHARLIIEATA